MDIFVYDGSIVNKVSSLDEINTDLVWIDITNITKDEESLVQKHFNLHPLSAEDLYNNNIRIKVEEFNDYVLCIFYALVKAKGNKIEAHEVDFVLGKNFLITNHKKSLPSIETLKNDTDRLSFLFKKGPDFLFHRVIDVGSNSNIWPMAYTNET